HIADEDVPHRLPGPGTARGGESVGTACREGGEGHLPSAVEPRVRGGAFAGRGRTRSPASVLRECHGDAVTGCRGAPDGDGGVTLQDCMILECGVQETRK